MRPGLCAVSGCIPDAPRRRWPCASHGPVARFDGCDSPGDPTPVPSSSRATPHGTVRSPAPRPPVTECRWCVRDPFGLTDCCLVRWSPAFRPRARGKICNLTRRGAMSARDGPRPSVEGARHCPSDHGGKREATLMIHVVHQRRSPLVSAGSGPIEGARTRKTKWLVPISRWFLRLPG